MKHGRKKVKRRLPIVSIIFILVLGSGVFAFHNYLTHNGIHVQWDKGRKPEPPTRKCSSGWLWRPTTSTWVCTKP